MNRDYRKRREDISIIRSSIELASMKLMMRTKTILLLPISQSISRDKGKRVQLWDNFQKNKDPTELRCQK